MTGHSDKNTRLRDYSEKKTKVVLLPRPDCKPPTIKDSLPVTKDYKHGEKIDFTCPASHTKSVPVGAPLQYCNDGSIADTVKNQWSCRKSKFITNGYVLALHAICRFKGWTLGRVNGRGEQDGTLNFTDLKFRSFMDEHIRYTYRYMCEWCVWV